jgi:two-component system, chemotaxis family, sensor kinase CheA
MSAPDPHAEFLGAFMEDYFAECEEHLTSVRRGLLTLDAAIGHAEPPRAIVDELFRSFHSLKGISAMVEMKDAERLSHDMESCLRAIRAREIPMSTPTLDALVEGAKTLEQLIGAKRAGADAPPIDAVLARLDGVLPVAAAPYETAAPNGAAARAGGLAAAATAWRVTFRPSPDLVARGIKVDTIRARLLEISQIQSVTPHVTAGGGITFVFEVIGGTVEQFSVWRTEVRCSSHSAK